MNTTTKTVYGFTKSRAYGLCGVALAMAFLGTGSVSADEATPANTEPVVSVTAPTSSVSSEVATEQPVALEKADLIVSEVTPSQTQSTTVESTPVLSDSIKQAETAGVEVAQNPTVFKGNVKSVEEESAKIAEIQADYNKQAEAVKKATEEAKKSQAEYEEAKKVYDAEVAKREEALKNPNYHTESDSFGKEEIDSFLNNTDLAALSYVVLSDATTARVDTSSLKKTTVEELDALVAKVKDVAPSNQKTIDDLKNGKNVHLYTVSKGDTWLYKDAFVDAVSGKKISMKYKYLGGRFKGEQIDTAILQILDGIQVTQSAQEEENEYEIDFLDESGNVVNVKKLLIGFGDIDYGQYVGVYSDSLDKDHYLAGSAQTVTKDGNGLLATSPKDLNIASSAETAGQFWVLLSDSNGFRYKFGEPSIGGTQNRFDYFVGQWHQLGNVAFGLEIPPVPVAPTKPEAKKVSYTLASYNKVGSVKIRVETTDGFVFDEESHVDISTGSDFDSSKTKGNLVNINGRPYRIVEIKGDETGKIELGEKEIIYVVKPQVTTTWITDGGDPLKDPKTGDDPEPNGEFPDYEFVKTVTKPNGDVEHIFKKIEKPVPSTPEDPKEPAKPVVTPTVNKPEVPQAPVKEAPKPVVQKSAATLPETGTAASALGLVGFVSALLGIGAVGKRKKDSE